MQRSLPWLVVASMVVVGCGRKNQRDRAGPDHADPHVARTKIERGPVRVTVEVQPQPVRLSDEPTLTLTIDYERGITIEKPPFGEAIGDFIIRDYREPLPEIEKQREIIRQIYRLEPTRTGMLQIHPITVAFTDHRADGDGQRHILETEALAIEVSSVLDSESPSLNDLAEMTGPVELPRRSSFVMGWLVLLLLLLVACGVGVWFVVRRRTVVEEKLLSPQERAYLELEELIRENLGETDIKLFYVRLTGIVRRYIERTTSVHAPEQTTEEFLRDISNGNIFTHDEQGRLRSFLESADLVKFAAHEPTAKDIEETFQRAKVFIGIEGQEVAA